MTFSKLILSIGAVIALSMAHPMVAQDNQEEMLEMSLEDLMNIKVTVASKTEEKVSDAPGVISVITKEELARFGGMSLKDILERVPGLTTLAYGWTDRNSLASRGDMVKTTASHILILINGRPTREIVEGGIISDMMGAFPVNIIDRIEVIRGPGSVLYGSNAMSAVINIVSEEVERNSLSYTEILGVDGSSGRTAQATVYSGDLKATIAGRMLKKATQHFSISNIAYHPEFFYPTDTVTQRGDGEDSALGAFANISFKGLSATAALQSYQTTYTSQGIVDESKWTKSFFNVGYDLNISDNWKSSINTTYNNASFRSADVPGNFRRSHDVVAEWTNYLNFGDKINLTVGGLYNYMQGTETLTVASPQLELEKGDTISHNTRGALALYSQLDYWAIKNKLKLIGGFQVNKMEDLDLDIVPRLGTIWYLTDKINIKALYGQAYRAGSINETGINYGNVFIGNPDIKPEHTENIDVGINYQGSRAQLGINYFHTTFKNNIVQGWVTVENPDTTYFITSYVNSDTYSFDGLEFEGKVYLTDDLLLTGSMLYQKLNADSTVRTPIADFSFKAGVSYTFDRGVTISLFDIYQGELNQDQFFTDGLNPDPRGSYNILNMYLNMNLVELFNMNIDQKISFFVQGENILDTEVWLPEGFVSSPYDYGRSIYLGLSFDL